MDNLTIELGTLINFMTFIGVIDILQRNDNTAYAPINFLPILNLFPGSW